LEMADPTLHSTIPSSPATPLPITARSVSLSRRNHSADNHQHTLSGSSTPDESLQRKPRKVLGNYTLSKTLGAGSMGKVKLAIHGITGHKVLLCCSFISFFHDHGSFSSLFIYETLYGNFILMSNTLYFIFRFLLHS
jgi:hypothetical protein